MSDITRYVVTVLFDEQTLTEINEVTNHLTRAGFTLTLTDDEGKIHELGTNNFGFISSQADQDIKALTSGLAESALHKKPVINVLTFERWLENK